jgi:hypothetical protein
MIDRKLCRECIKTANTSMRIMTHKFDLETFWMATRCSSLGTGACSAILMISYRQARSVQHSCKGKVFGLSDCIHEKIQTCWQCLQLKLRVLRPFHISNETTSVFMGKARSETTLLWDVRNLIHKRHYTFFKSNQTFYVNIKSLCKRSWKIRTKFLL